MKPLMIALLTLFFSSSAVLKNNASQKELEKQLIGKWKFTGQKAGFSDHSKSKNTSLVNVIEFKKGGKYVRYKNDEPMYQGNYKLCRTKSIFSGKVDNAICFDVKVNVPQKEEMITLVADKLVLKDNVDDGYTSDYTRLN
jgi:hypothetical protein